jgi:hypothetical protein
LFTCPVAVIKKAFCLVLFFFLLFSSSPFTSRIEHQHSRVHRRFPTSTLKHLSTRLGISTSSRISFVSATSLFSSGAIGLGLVVCPIAVRPLALHSPSTTPLPQINNDLDNPSSSSCLFSLLTKAARHRNGSFANPLRKQIPSTVTMAVFTIKALASALAVFSAFATGAVADELPELPEAALCMFSSQRSSPSPR